MPVLVDFNFIRLQVGYNFAILVGYDCVDLDQVGRNANDVDVLGFLRLLFGLLRGLLLSGN